MSQDRRNRVKSLILGGSPASEEQRNDSEGKDLTKTGSKERPAGEGVAEGIATPSAGGSPSSPTAAKDATKEQDLAAVKNSVPSNAGVDTSSAKKAPAWTSRMTSGAVRGLNLSLQNVPEGSVVELDPKLLDPSMVVDRVEDAADQTFSALVESVRERGQQVPILVRPHPGDTSRYQIAYGHRRWRAASRLGLPVRAVVRTLSDDELVVAQGKENLERRDLSYIERALFAWRMESQGFGRDTICAAMATVDSEVSRFIAVAKSVPEQLIAVIGPAPKVGRPRWLAFADRLNAIGAAAAETVTLEPGFGDKPTDERFAAVLAALQPKTEAKPPKPRVWKDEGGRRLARFEETAERFSLTIDRKIEPDFGRYLVGWLPEILAAFKAGEASPDPQRNRKGDE